MIQCVGAVGAFPTLGFAGLKEPTVRHKSYQDFQAFLEKGGKIGLQHDRQVPGGDAKLPLPLG